MPGGCDLGIRPMDQHIKGFEFLGADVSIENAMVNAQCRKAVGSSVYIGCGSVALGEYHVSCGEGTWAYGD